MTASIINLQFSKFPEGLVDLANAIPLGVDADVVLVPMPNEYVIGDNEWWEVPFADVPYELQSVKGVQRLNKEVAGRMVSLFNSWRGKLTRRFGGRPVYVGHPDVEYFANRGDTDDSSYGWILEMEVREDCLALKVDLTAPGAEILANKSYKWFSPYFFGKYVGIENGTKIYEPVWLNSAGFTNNPRWPVAALVNEDTGTAAPEGGNMTLLQKLIALLDLGKDGAEAATEDGVVSTVAKLIEAAKKMQAEMKAHWDAQDAAFEAVPNEAGLDEQLTAIFGVLDGKVEALVNERGTFETKATDLETRITGLETVLVAHRDGRIELLVNSAVADGRITQAQVEQWTQDLAKAEDFAATATALVNAEKIVKTKPTTGDLGARQGSQLQNRDQFLALVNKRMGDVGEDYETAFAAIKADTTHAALLEGDATA